MRRGMYVSGTALLVLWVGLILFNIGCSDLRPALALASVLLIGLGVALVALIGRHWRIFTLGLLIVFVAVTAWRAGLSYTRYKERLTFVEGDKIVSALERFRSENGHYPESLQDLRPRYLTEIPRTMMFFSGSTFSYRRSGESFVLEFSSHFPDYGMYLTKERRWIIT